MNLMNVLKRHSPRTSTFVTHLHCIYLFILLSVGATHVSAVDEDRLWLPVKYQSLYTKLYDAAKAAEAIERCESVLKGGLDVEKSTKDKPIFRILCRQKNGLSYNEMVDGLSMETLTTPKVIYVPPTEEELEQIRIEEERKRVQLLSDHRQEAWTLCDAEIKDKTKRMKRLTWLTIVPPDPISQKESRVEFQLDFNSVDVYEAPLKYRLRCVSDTKNEILELNIKRRKDS